METKVAISVNGQAVLQQDLNTIAEEAARTDDWQLATLIRPGIATSGVPLRYIIPSGGAVSIDHGGAVVESSGLTNATVYVNPFTAVIGSRSSLTPSVKDAIRDIRTVTHFGDDTFHSPRFRVQLPATTAGFYRWDLIWARVDVDVADAAVPRFVKDGSGQATSQLISVSSRTLLTIGRTGGTEVSSGTAVLPTIPADSGTSFYIPLAYVGLGTSHTLTTQIDGRHIREVFPTSGVASPHGVSRLRPANGAYKIGGFVQNDYIWNANGDPSPSYISPAMQGGESLIIPLRMQDGSSRGSAITPNTSTRIDDSCDWRKRLFKLFVSVVIPSNNGMPWYSPLPPHFQPFYQENGASPMLVFGANSFTDREAGDTNSVINVFTGGAITAGNILLILTDATTPALATGAKLALYVDPNDNGSIRAWRNGVDANREAIIWLEATSPFRNTDLSST